MIRKLGIIRDDKGAAVIEMALAIPILLELLWIVFQGGLIFRAMSGIQHGLGEGVSTRLLIYAGKAIRRSVEPLASVPGIGLWCSTLSTSDEIGGDNR